MQASLIVLAAGLGSRYQGLKQMDHFGPAGESILDYTVCDAIQVGFDHIVFVINQKMKDEFIPSMKSKLNGKIETSFVVQHISDLPDNFDLPIERAKPWGTGHALYVCRNVVKENFAMVNADDFYGRKALEAIRTHLDKLNTDHQAVMVGYILANTLSDFGSVSRGICSILDGNLNEIVERTAIQKRVEDVFFEQEGKRYPLSGNEIVSMNLMGFSKEVFGIIESEFRRFLKVYGKDLKKEFYAPNILQYLIKKGQHIPVLQTDANWFGVTYPEDKKLVRQNLLELINQGEYPHNLWE